MDNFLESIAEILEEDIVEFSDHLSGFDSWDSLTILSIIALSDESYKVTLSATEIEDSKTIEGLKKLIESKL